MNGCNYSELRSALDDWTRRWNIGRDAFPDSPQRTKNWLFEGGDWTASEALKAMWRWHRYPSSIIVDTPNFVWTGDDVGHLLSFPAMRWDTDFEDEAAMRNRVLRELRVELDKQVCAIKESLVVVEPPTAKLKEHMEWLVRWQVQGKRHRDLVKLYKPDFQSRDGCDKGDGWPTIRDGIKAAAKSIGLKRVKGQTGRPPAQ